MSDGVVTFDYGLWQAQFPSLAMSVDIDQATLYFGMSGLYLENDGLSQVCDLAKRGLILNLLTAHLATLFASINGQAPNPLVGRISQATEGSVSVSVEFPQSANAAWFNQTPYGAAAWVAMAPYRTAFYAAAPQIPLADQSWPGQGAGFGGPFGVMPFNGGFPWPR